VNLTDAQQDTLIEAAVVIVLTLVSAGVIDRVLRRREQAILQHFPGDPATIRTRYRIVKRVLISSIVAVALFSVLLAFDDTRRLAGTVMASGAVVALIVGLAVRTPLANLAAGLQLAFTQPYRLGDRVTVANETGVVEEIRIAHTVLRADDGRRVFLPNESLVTQAIVNATIGADDARVVTVTLPAAPDADLPRVRALLREEALCTPGATDRAPLVRVTEVLASGATLTVTLWVDAASDVDEAGAGLRERGAMRLAAEHLLAVGTPGA
jgi:small-conductance mechanosensitive channel